MNWQPIETAPKDGTEVLLFGAWAGEVGGMDSVQGTYIGHFEGCGDYAEHGFVWSVAGGDAYMAWCKPSHWMPLPPSPIGLTE